MPATLPALAGEQCKLDRHTEDVDRPFGQILKALSIKQPWAWLIVNGYKDVENRSRRTHFRGRILVHAGKTMTRADYDACVLFMQSCLDVLPPLPDYKELRAQCGGFVGEVDIVDCVTWSDSPWFTSDFGWVLARPKAFELRPALGTLGFFKVGDL